MSGTPRRLVWFRNDLRVHDHAALVTAMRDGEAIGVFCVCGDQWRAHDVAPVRVDFLLRSLAAHARALAALGVPLRILDCGTFAAVPRAIVQLARDTGARAIHCIDEYPLNERRRDAAVRVACEHSGIEFHVHAGGTILEPGTVSTQDGRAFAVFTPFRRRWQARLDEIGVRPLGVPRPQALPEGIASDPVPSTVSAYPDARSAAGADLWPAGEIEALRRLDRFLSSGPRSETGAGPGSGSGSPDGHADAGGGRNRSDARTRRETGSGSRAAPIDGYADARDLPARPATSGLSPYLSIGAISARTCLDGARRAEAIGSGNPDRDRGGNGPDAWIGELAWRDFYRHVLVARPDLAFGRSYRREFEAVAWRDAPADLAAWQQGRTGVPLVDAGMRQLLATGWMHNRVRMVAAQLLCKHLLIDWREGERWFMRHLVDGDFAANNGGWQWSASTGTDAAPYFRVFNPVSQAKRFDADGTYVRTWIPELADVPDARILEPWKGRDLFTGGGYPEPIVDLKAARARAIDAWRDAQQAGPEPDATG